MIGDHHSPAGSAGPSAGTRVPTAKETDPDALANLYPEAAAYVAASWAPGRLESRAKAVHSSQALCVSVLITLRQRPAEQRAAISAAICEQAGLVLPVESATEIDAEIRQHRALLGEVGGGTPTALDGLISSDASVLTIESKFTEREFGPCGQIKWAKVEPHDQRFDEAHPNRKFRNCTGWHAPGSDQKPTTSPQGAACRLTVKDGRRQPRRYWDVAPYLFEPAFLATPQKCPFATDAYQLMRNLAFAHEWAAEHKLPSYGFLVTLVDGAPKARELRQRVAAFRGLLKSDVRDRVGAVSYECIADVLDQYGEGPLANWVRKRLAAGLSSRGSRS